MSQLRVFCLFSVFALLGSAHALAGNTLHRVDLYMLIDNVEKGKIVPHTSGSVHFNIDDEQRVAVENYGLEGSWDNGCYNGSGKQTHNGETVEFKLDYCPKAENREQHFQAAKGKLLSYLEQSKSERVGGVEHHLLQMVFRFVGTLTSKTYDKAGKLVHVEYAFIVPLR